MFVNILVVLALFVSYMSPYINPEVNRYIPLAGLLFPYLFFVNFIFFLLWLFTKWTYSLLSLATLIVGFTATQRFISFDSIKVIKSPELIHVSSYNVASGLMIRSKEKDDFYNFIHAQYQDGIFFFQESSSKIMETLRKKYPNENYIQIAGKRATIMSHFPVIDSGMLDFQDNYNVCVWADVDMYGQKVRIYSVHLQSNRITQIADEVAAKGEIGDKKTWDDVKKMLGRYSYATVKRLAQVKTIIHDVESIDYPAMVVGDFNDVPQSYLYTEISEYLKDAFVERGYGLGTSFNGSIPALRIDYIFVDEAFQVLNYKTHKVNYSDHYPISGEFILQK